jgi:predicted amidohydrolase
MRILLASINPTWEEKQKNLEMCKKVLTYAREQHVDLVIFPEMTLTGFTSNILGVTEPRKKSESLEAFQSLARENRIAIVFGMVLRSKKQNKNVCFFLDRNGVVLGNYAKLHTFSPSGESQTVSRGKSLSLLNFQGFGIGLTVCYDLRFPVIYTAMASKVELFINIANWPDARIDHWNTLLKARAIENQAFVVGINRIGVDDNSIYYSESSNIVSPRGELLKPISNLDHLSVYELDISEVIQVRKDFPIIRDRRLKLYRKLLR